LNSISQVNSILNSQDLQSGFFKFLGLGFVNTIKNTAKASEQFKLLNDDMRELKTGSVDELTDAYIFYEGIITKIGDSDANYTKLLENQLKQIEQLVIQKKAQNKVDDISLQKTEEQKEGIIDILLAVDKKLKYDDLQKQSIDELNAKLTEYSEAENKRVEDAKKRDKDYKKAAKKDEQTFLKDLQNLKDDAAIAALESETEQKKLKIDQDLRDQKLKNKDLKIKPDDLKTLNNAYEKRLQRKKKQ
jgi:hypothetical protein